MKRCGTRQQQPRRLLPVTPSSLNTSSHSRIPVIHPFPAARLRGFLLRLLSPCPSTVNPLFILPPSLAPVPQAPLSPYCIPLCGSSGSTSPNSIFVRIILANLENTSSTFSPDKADTSTATGMFWEDAHRD